jgi:hypothetical protein
VAASTQDLKLRREAVNWLIEFTPPKANDIGCPSLPAHAVVHVQREHPHISQGRSEHCWTVP